MFKRSHRQNFRYALLAVLALFIAQLGALAHAYTHQPSTVAVTAKSQQAHSAHEFCSDCLNFAPLLAAGPSAAEVPLALEHVSSVAPAAGYATLLAHRTYLAFRSRAPPVTR